MNECPACTPGAGPREGTCESCGRVWTIHSTGLWHVRIPGCATPDADVVANPQAFRLLYGLPSGSETVSEPPMEW